MKYNDNGEVKEITVKTLDTLPVGAIIDYDGSEVPDGWVTVGSTYSTEEVKTGDTWINGKPIYRKVFVANNVSTGTTVIDTNINNIEEIIKLNGILYRSNGNNMPIPGFSPGDNTKQISLRNDVTPKKIAIEIGGGITYSTKVTIIYEYTKTTDLES